MQKFSVFLKTSLFCLIVFLSLFGISQNSQAQSWVQEATQGGFIIKKVVSDTAVCTGQPFSYTIYYTIPAGATNVTIIDNLAPGGMFLGASYSNACGTPTVVTPTINQMGGTYSLSWASVPTSCTGSFTISVAFPNGTTCPGTTLRNNVCLMGTLDNKLYEFCTGYVNVTALANNPWHINKYPIGVAWQGGNCPYASASDTITYQICVYKDVGTTCQLNLVNGVVKDTLPTGAVLVSSTCGATQSGNVITWNVGNLNANQMYNSACCNFVVYYPPSLFPAGTPLVNKATLSGGLGSPQPPCSNFTTQSQQTCVQVGSFTKGTLYKWVYTNRQPGCAGQYVIYVCNNGTTSLPVTVLDTLPVTLTGYSLGPQWNLTGSLSSGIVSITGTLAPGQCGYVYVNFTIPANATVGSTITNCAWLTNSAGGPPSAACVSFVVDAPASTPCLWKEVCNKQTSYTPGSVFRYRLRIQNIGGLPLTGASITDVLDPNLQYVGNPSAYISNSWNTPCQTTPATPWNGAVVSNNPSNNTVTVVLDTIPAVCQTIFYINCGMYGTGGVPYYFIEFDVKVRDSSALGNVPNKFSLAGGSLGTVIYPSNIDYVLIVGTVGFSVDKGVKKPSDPNYGTGVTTSAGSTVDYKLKMNSSGTAQLRYVTFADLLPRDVVSTDQKILQLCGPRGSTGNFDIRYNALINASPAITQWKNPIAIGLANVNNLFPTGAPGNAFTNGCGTSGTWGSGWVALDRNLGSHFGSAAIGVGGASVEFSANLVSGAVPPTGSLCNTFAASGWTKHLIQSNIVNFQLAGQSESSPVCVTIDTVKPPTHCIDSVKIQIKCIGKNAAGLYDYSIQITASSCAPATLLMNSPDGTFVPATFSLASSPWTINPTFTHTSANNPIKIYYTLLCNGVVCRDSLFLDLPPCDQTHPEECCDKFIRKIEKPQIAWTSAGLVNFALGMSAGPAPIKKFTATIVSAQLRRPNTAWQRIFGDIVGGSLVVAPAPGPQLLSLFSREAVWGEGQCIDWNQGANLILKMVFPPVSGFGVPDTLRFAIRYSFTDCNCLTCDTVVYYTIPRKVKWIPWDDIGIGFVRGSAKGNDNSDKPQSEQPASTSLLMDDANNGSLWIISPDNPDNDVIITGVEVNSMLVQMTGIKNGNTDGIMLGDIGFVEADINKGDNVPINLTFDNQGPANQFPVYVRFAYKMEGFDEILYSEPLLYNARVPGVAGDEMAIDNTTKPANVASYALYISNSNGYQDGISAISIKPLGSLKLLAVGPPSSEDGSTMLIPHLLEDGSYIITVPAPLKLAPLNSGLEASKTAKPVFLTLSGVDAANADVEFTTFDNEMQQISQGTLTLSDPISAVENGDGGLHYGTVLNPVAPNPAKNFVTISFALNETESNAKLSIIDMKGTEVLKVLDNQIIQQGSYIRGVDVSSLPSGAYFIVLRTQNGTSTKSLSIVR